MFTSHICGAVSLKEKIPTDSEDAPNVPAGTSRNHVHVGPQQPPPPPIPISTVNSPTTILFGGGSGTSACGSVTRSPTRAAGFPSISTTPVPPSGIGAVIPGPCGAPSHTGGGAFGIVQVC